MSTHLKQKEEKILDVIDALAIKSAKGFPIMVEGRKDMDALRSFNIVGTVLMFKTGGKSFIDAVTEIESTGASSVILLLDFDRRGKESTKKIKQYLERAKITPELKFWQDLNALLGRDVQSIEGIPSYMATLQAKTI